MDESCTGSAASRRVLTFVGGEVPTWVGDTSGSGDDGQRRVSSGDRGIALMVKGS